MRSSVGRLRATAGVRADQVRFQLRDAFLSDGRDDSGIRTLHAVSPMFGSPRACHQSTRCTQTSAPRSRRRRPPSLATRRTAAPGSIVISSRSIQRRTKPARRGWPRAVCSTTSSLFDTEVRDELIPFEVADGNGRTFYRNAGRTRRQGAELELSTDAGPLSLTAAYALSHFRFRDFVNGTAQLAGNTIPGIPEHQLQGDRHLAFGSRVRRRRGHREEPGVRQRRECRGGAGVHGVQCPRRRHRGVRSSLAVAGGRRTEPLRSALHRVCRRERGRRVHRGNEILRARAGSHLVRWTQRCNESVVALAPARECTTAASTGRCAPRGDSRAATA